MESPKKSQSLGFIVFLFSLWFLIVPLVYGIQLFKRYKNESLDSTNRFTSKITSLEGQLSEKNETIKALQSWVEQMNSKTKEIEQGIKQHEQSLNQLEKDLKLNYEQKIKEDRKHFDTRERELSIVQEELLERKKDLDKIVELKFKEIRTLDFALQLKLIPKIREKEEELSKREQIIIQNEKETDILQKEISILQKRKLSLEDDLLYESFGFYDEKYGLGNSTEYLHFLELVRKKQKELVMGDGAVEFHIGSLLNGIAGPELKKSKYQIKLAIRTFNSECDAAIRKVKFSNVEVAEKKIRTSFYEVNSLNKYNSLEITASYLNLKLEELFLVHEYNMKRYEEMEEQRRINELIREEKIAQKELEEELGKIKKEEQHLLNVINQRANQITEEEVIIFKKRLEEIQKQKEEVDYRVKNTRAGYVYIISNIGCFGEDTYKIGMTRRLDPLDRVKELGGASVPFHFDVHAIIFSEDAPALEATLHRKFHHRRVNKINERKEFFKVSLEEIRKVVHRNHTSSIEFTMMADAKEYRETLLFEKNNPTVLTYA